MSERIISNECFRSTGFSYTLSLINGKYKINRKEYPQIPPKVEYSLTERGKSLIPILNAICDWGEENAL